MKKGSENIKKMSGRETTIRSIQWRFHWSQRRWGLRYKLGVNCKNRKWDHSRTHKIATTEGLQLLTRQGGFTMGVSDWDRVDKQWRKGLGMKGQGTGKISYAYSFQFHYKDWGSTEERGNEAGAKITEERRGMTWKSLVSIMLSKVGNNHKG